ncbi:SDR family NAD(P)-dependent oxidoreductase [Thermogymnomonas acidicola]|uniref:SDR family NAD(P)-dependent oxidoreductase n=1 Tax=Thermogymnomonas acidicola TaxID=399579 RepID=UPI00149464B3|nr:SDR family NAD(P)-dependent oxidoreductase [Thermogymnomonas acidicola]
MPLLDGMLSLVTGASRGGIGRAVALRLASEGSDVALIYREDHVDAESTAREIEAMGGCRAVAVRCDVSEPEDVARACSQIRVEVGWPDVVVNNAGVMLNGDIMEQPPQRPGRDDAHQCLQHSPPHQGPR